MRQFLRIIQLRKPIYVEIINKEKKEILIRPVKEYFIDKKNIEIENDISNNLDNSIGIKIVNKILYRDGEQVKSATGVELVKNIFNNGYKSR